MTDADKGAFAKVMLDLSQAFRGGETTADRISVYWEHLKDLSIASVRFGADQLLHTEIDGFWPTPAKIRQEALQYSPPTKLIDPNVKQLKEAEYLPLEESARRMGELARKLKIKNPMRGGVA